MRRDSRTGIIAVASRIVRSLALRPQRLGVPVGTGGRYSVPDRIVVDSPGYSHGSGMTRTSTASLCSVPHALLIRQLW